MVFFGHKPLVKENPNLGPRQGAGQNKKIEQKNSERPILPNRKNEPRGDFFAGKSQISVYDLERHLKSPEMLSKLGMNYKISGPYTKSVASSEDVKSIIDSIPKESGGFISKSEASHIVKKLQSEARSMQSQLKPTAEVNKVLERARFLKDIFGL